MAPDALRSLVITEVEPDAFAHLWPALEPIARAGEEFLWPRDVAADAAKRLWFCPGARVFAARAGDDVLGTAYLQPNAQGPGDHVANAAFAVGSTARGRGVGRALAEHVLDAARAAGFTAMQFNAVVSANTAAIALWRDLGFVIVGTVPGAFRHPKLGAVDLHVMHRAL